MLNQLFNYLKTELTILNSQLGMEYDKLLVVTFEFEFALNKSKESGEKTYSPPPQGDVMCAYYL